MCGLFGNELENRYRGFIPASDALVQRTRVVESAMKGDPVPEAAWQAFFSPDCGAIDLAHFERMFLARKVAVAYLAIQASSRRKPRPATAFRCIAD